MKTRKKDEVDRFKDWIARCGGEVLVTTNEWEVVRFRGDGVTSIIYVNKSGTRSFTGRARAAWDAFKTNDNAFRITKRPVGLSQRQRKKAPIIRTLLDRDGHACFYCGDPFTDAQPPTKEHLIPKPAGGPDHISNLFLACHACNTEAGHMSVPEKIRMRDRKRRGRGSALLQGVLDCGGNVGGNNPRLLGDIRNFLHAAPAATEESTDATA